MVNFEAELDKLLVRETGMFPQDKFAELAAADQELLAELNRKQTDFSLQIEEIYDLVKEQEVLQETVRAGTTRTNLLIQAAMDLSDLLEDFYAYAGRGDDEALQAQAKLMWENAAAILAGCGILRFGEKGQALNPQIHTVKAGVESPLPVERVVEVLRSGYAYQGILVRKAAVVISRRQENGDRETDTADAGAADHHERMAETGDHGGDMYDDIYDTDDNQSDSDTSVSEPPQQLEIDDRDGAFPKFGVFSESGAVNKPPEHQEGESGE
jgi:molecular chaperone GrpE (heat shock protein)